MAKYAEFEPIDPAAEGPAPDGRPQQTAREIARQAAADAIGRNTVTPGSQFSDTPVKSSGQSDHPLESETSQHLEAESEPTDYDDDDYDDEPQPEPTRRAREQDDVPPISDEDYEELRELGIEMPMEPNEVPNDLRPTYDRLVQTAIQTRRDAEVEILDTQRKLMDVVEQVKDFQSRLASEDGQQRLLLSLGLNNPEVFSQAVETISRMQEDPEYAENVRRRLEAEVKYEAAERKERALRQTEMARKGQQVESRTVNLARRLGVDPGWAKEEVSKKILLNEAHNGQRDISLREVDEVVKTLARRAGSRPRRPTAKSPETADRERRANTKRTEGTGRQAQPSDDRGRRRPAAPSQGASPHALDRLRGAVKESAERMRSKGL